MTLLVGGGMEGDNKKCDSHNHFKIFVSLLGERKILGEENE